MINEKLLEQIRQITREEQNFLDGGTQVDKDIYLEESGSVIDSKKIIDHGKLIQIRPHARFVHYPKHSHNFIEAVYMCTGQTRHIINGDEVVLQEGEILFLSQNAVQEIFPAGKDDIAVNFIILPEFFDVTLQLIGEEENLIRDFVVGCLQGHDSSIDYLHFKVAEVLPIQNLMENLIWTIWNNQQNKRSINQVTMALLFLHLINHTDKIYAGENNRDQDTILAVLRYVEENYRNGKFEDLAATLNYDMYWLSRMVKKQTGMTFTELMQIKRLSQATFLLRTTKLSVADIGNRVGYDNLSYFHRIFRERYSQSPKNYRDSIKNKSTILL